MSLLFSKKLGGHEGIAERISREIQTMEMNGESERIMDKHKQIMLDNLHSKQ
ncbi:MAG: hypothetical protein OCC46_02145 [Pseudodesulfovibrio sp.]